MQQCYSKKKKLTVISFIILLMIFFIYLSLHYYENFHAVIPGKVYRSAELNQNEFIHRVHQKKLRTVINLRGENEQFEWYRIEKRTLKHLGAHLYNFRLSSYHLPPKNILQQLAITLETAPKPILIHCASGIDRTGLASAMVILLHNGTIKQAKHQLSLIYGDLMPSSAGKLFLKQYTQWLQKNHIHESTAPIFKSWLGIDENNASILISNKI